MTLYSQQTSCGEYFLIGKDSGKWNNFKSQVLQLGKNYEICLINGKDGQVNQGYQINIAMYMEFCIFNYPLGRNIMKFLYSPFFIVYENKFCQITTSYRWISDAIVFKYKKLLSLL